MGLPLLWFLLGLAFLAVELVNPSLVSCFFGIGAWVAACASLADLSLGWQAVIFMGASLLSLVLLRRRFRHVFGGRSETASNAHDYGGSGEKAPPHPLAGHTGLVSKAIRPDGRGEVHIDGSFWRATAQKPIPQGREVRVLGAAAEDSLLLLVKPLADTESNGAP